MKVLFLIPQLVLGGAERQMVELARGMRQRDHDARICVFRSGGALAEFVRNEAIPVYSCDERHRIEGLLRLQRVKSFLRDFNPDVVHGYLTVPNILAALIKNQSPASTCVFGIRGSSADARFGLKESAALSIERFLSSRADVIVTNSHAGRLYATSRGMDARKLAVVHNGIDTAAFQREDEARERVRSDWGVARNEVLVGLVARIDPVKDHRTFILAANKAVEHSAALKFVVIGDGDRALRDSLKGHVSAALAPRLTWAGARSDMTAVYSAIDCATLTSSHGEGFPNAIAEAMACECYCVATDVGDVSMMLHGVGALVPPRSPDALAREWLAFAESDAELRRKRGTLARSRVLERFSVSRLVDSTIQLLDNVSARAARRDT